MATAQTIIDRAMRLIGALESGESATSAETADALIALNQLIDSWRNDRLMVYAVTNVTKTLTIGDGSYTIGSGADINTTRPVKVVGAYVTDNSIDYPIEIIDEPAWRNIAYKTNQSQYPLYLYYDPQVANGTINLYPVPSAANVLTLTLWTPIGTLSTAATSITLPVGYERALTYALAIDIAPEFGRAVPPEVAESASKAIAAIKKANARPIYAQMEMGRGRRADIYADGP